MANFSSMLERGLQLTQKLSSHIHQKTSGGIPDAGPAINTNNQTDWKSLLMTLSHEVRAPLQALNWLIEGTSGMSQSNQIREEARRSIEHIQALCEDILTLANDQTHTSASQGAATALDLQTVISDAVNLVAPLARKKRIRLIVDWRNTEISLHGNSTKLRQIVLNYLSNAIKFSEDGDIRISCRWTAHTTGHASVRLEVQDCGPGLSFSECSAVFEPFKQGSAFNPGKHSGIGLGLSLVKTYCDLMHGKCGATSRQGLGSTFWAEVQLPLVKVDTPPANSLKHLNLLLADTQISAITCLADQLKDSGATVMVVDDLCRAAFHSADGRPFSAAIIDGSLMDRAISRGMWRPDHPIRNVILLADAPPPHLPAHWISLPRTATFKEIARAVQQTQERVRRRLTNQEAASPHPFELPKINLDSKPRLMVIDDDLFNLMMMRELIQSMRIHTDTFQNPTEALAAARTTNYDLVITDLHMAHMSGIELSMALRSELGYTGPIVVISGSDEAQLKSLPPEADITLALRKPVQVEQLIAMITPLIRHT